MTAAASPSTQGEAMQMDTADLQDSTATRMDTWVDPKRHAQSPTLEEEGPGKRAKGSIPNASTAPAQGQP
jgi:hypothetical protein